MNETCYQMKFADWRGLCEELASCLQGRKDLECGWPGEDPEQELLDRARAALAEPVGEGVTLQLLEQAPDEHPPSNLDRREVAAWYHGHGCGWQAARAALAAKADGPAVQSREPASVVREPSDEDLLELAEDWPATTGPRHDLSGCPEVPLYSVFADEVVEFARAVLARWGHQPAPPAEGEVADETRYLVKELRDQADDLSPSLELFGLVHRAADLLEQRQAAPVPVAVSERLPEPEDCDEEGRFWAWCKATKEWCLLNRWHYREESERNAPGWASGWPYWLPAHALPLPQGEVE